MAPKKKSLLALLNWKLHKKKGHSADLLQLAPDYCLSHLSILNENLVVQEKIGEGSFGSVWKGILSFSSSPSSHIHQQQFVAVKELFLKDGENTTLANEKFGEFNHECSIMSQLDHKNIVKLFGITTSPALRIVMEWCPLPDLRKHLSSPHLLTHEAYTLQLKLCFALDISKGLEFLHSSKPPIVHVNIIPSPFFFVF